MRIDAFLERLEGVRRSGEGWTARCPAHEDRQPSLSVSEGSDARVLVRCFAGCSVDAIAASLGLEVSDLFAQNGATPPIPPVRRFRVSDKTIENHHAALVESEGVIDRLHELRGWTPETLRTLRDVGLDGQRVTFGYRDDAGTLVGLGRYQPNPEERRGPKVKADQGSKRNLFPPPETLAADSPLVFLTEGEPDALRALSLGLEATSVPGVQGWRAEWAPRFAGRSVCVVFDCDQEGRSAAQRVASDLRSHASEVRVLDLDPAREDGFDLSDFVASARTPEEDDAARRMVLDMAERLVPIAAPESAPANVDAGARFRFTSLKTFLDHDYPQAEPLLGETEQVLLAVGSFLITYGADGAGKSTWVIDGIAHMAAGVSWLGIPVPRPVKFCLIENEGPPSLFQKKLEAKIESWEGPDWQQNVRVLAGPWGEFTFNDADARQELTAYCDEHDIDVVTANPTLGLGAPGSGKPDETQAFVDALVECGLKSRRAFWLIHHENKAGQISGDWGRHPDTHAHLQRDGDKPRTNLNWTKTRWASLPTEGIPKKCILEWVTETQGYNVVEIGSTGTRASDDELLAEMEAWLGANPHSSGKEFDAGLGRDRGRVRKLRQESERFDSIKGMHNADLWFVKDPDLTNRSADAEPDGEA